MSFRSNGINADPFDGLMSRLAAATADGSDPAFEDGVSEVLRVVRDVLQMDVAFVSQFVEGERVFRDVDFAPGAAEVIAVGGADPLEVSFCKRVLDGRLPEMVRDVAKLPNFAELPSTSFPIGAHLSTPIVLADGRVYGTLCCFSYSPDEALTERDIGRLRMAARMVGKLLDRERPRASS